MTIKYPDGRAFQRRSNYTKSQKVINKLSYSNRGMTLEEDINDTNEYYLANQIAIIHKKPTPVQIVNVNYPHRSAAVITEAYFKQPSTTDYNGVYKGKHLDFEVKETKSITSFPLKNIHEHQINHMKNVINHGGISFIIIRFTSSEEIFLLEGQQLFIFWKRMINGGRKSITKEEIINKGHKLKLGFQPRIDYLQLIDKLYELS